MKRRGREFVDWLNSREFIVKGVVVRAQLSAIICYIRPPGKHVEKSSYYTQQSRLLSPSFFAISPCKLLSPRSVVSGDRIDVTYLIYKWIARSQIKQFPLRGQDVGSTK